MKNKVLIGLGLGGLLLDVIALVSFVLGRPQPPNEPALERVAGGGP